jgi:hypothetical protein
MKFDSEKLVKNRFWILTGVCVPLALIALVVLGTSVVGKIRAERKKVEDDIKSIKNFSDPKRPDEVKFKEKEAELHKGLEDVVWKQAWEKQAVLGTWPEGVENKFHFKDGLFALKIQADRGKDTAAEEAASGSGEAPADQFKGVIIRHTKDWIDVEGKGGKAKKARVVRFQRTEDVKVTLNDDKGKDQAVPFSTLADKDRVTVTFQPGKYFGDKLTDTELDLFKESYKAQLADILKTVEPVDATGQGVVQLKNWAFDPEQIPAGAGFLVHHAGDWKSNRYLSKEAWTAQEDLWIQRELYRLVRLANSFVSRFHGQGGEGKGKAFTFTNPYWEMRLTLTEDNKLAVNLKNLLHKRQKADTYFLIKFRPDADPERVFVGGLEPLNPLEVKDAKPVPVKTEGATGIYGVDQVLTQDTAAVRRIDLVAIGAGKGGGEAGTGVGSLKPGLQTPGGSGGARGGSAATRLALSHRTFPKPLVPFRFPGDPTETEKEGEKESTNQTQGPGASGSMPKGMPGMPAGIGPPGADGGGAGGKGKPSANGFVFERYLDVTPQARRVPVGVVLIVDQQHVGLVQAAFADSGLRFLTNQVLLNRYPHSLRSPEATLVAGGAKGGPPTAPGLPPNFGSGGSMGFPRPPVIPSGGSFFPGSGSGGPGPMPGRMPSPGTGFTGGMAGQVFFPGMTGPGASGAAAGAADEPETNVELVLYGVVSLYERYPPRPSGS